MERAAEVELARARARSAGELVRQLPGQVSVLVRDELKLAPLEMR